MRQRLLKITLFSLTSIMLAANGMAQVPVWLSAGAGLNVADCYDNGTVPFRYMGLGANGDLGVTVEWSRFHIQTDARLLGNMLPKINGTSIDVDARTEFLYRVHDSENGNWHFWVGGGLQTWVDIKEIPAVMNASTGVSLFENLYADGMVAFDFATVRGSHKLLTAYGKLSLPLVGLAVRPGYAYMDNYTNDINVANALFSDYEAFFKAFAGGSTDIGLYLNLLNGNRIGLSYRWDYLSTGKKGAYRFDNALHTLNLSFMFRLN